MFEGYKTKLGAIGLALAGVAMIINSVVGDPLNVDGIVNGVGMVATALAAFGLGSKIDRK